MIKNIFKIIIFVSIVSFAFTTHAASIYFEPSNIISDINSSFEVKLLLDTEGESINAIDLEIDIPEGINIENILYGNSFITLWIEEPRVEDKKIKLSGIIPGGYKGIISPSGYKAGEVITLILNSESKENKNLYVSNSSILLNDGEGTEINTSSELLNYVYQDGIKQEVLFEDNQSPKDFTVDVSETDLFDDKYILVWNAIDKESGIDYYEIKIGDNDWEKGSSSYSISKSLLSKGVQVKAVDNFGNIKTTSIIYTGEIEQTGKSLWSIIITIVIIILLIFVILFLKKRGVSLSNDK